MNPKDSAAFITEHLNALNQEFGFNPLTLNEIQHYIQNLLHWNQRINLVGHKNAKDLIDQSILSCFKAAKYFLNHNLFHQQKGMDFGSGAGLPGIILKIVQQQQETSGSFQLHLIEARKKRALFLEQMNLKMNLKLWVHQARLEEIQESGFNWIITRATVSSTPTLVALFKPFLKKGGAIYLMKSQPLDSKLNVKSVENILLEGKKNQSPQYLVVIIP